MLFTFVSINLKAQRGKEYTDSKGDKFFLPSGRKAFADKIISQKKGKPSSKGKSVDVHNLLGEPDFLAAYDGSTFLSLGCGGEVIFEFTDNDLIDVVGPDLYIFEIGPSAEAFDVYVSRNNVNWIYVGQASGGTSAIDIHGKVKKGQPYNFVKLIDLKYACETNRRGSVNTSGADIDAVAAVNFVKRKKLQTKKIKKVKPQKQMKSHELASTKPKKVSKDSLKEKEIVWLKKFEGRKIEIKNEIIFSTDKVTIEIWDNNKVDGDIISLSLNGRWLLKKYTTKKKRKILQIELTERENLLILYAENLGEIAPNTAAVRVLARGIDQTVILNSDMGKSDVIKFVKHE